VPLPPAYLAVSNVFTALRLVPMSDREKDIEIFALRHQISVLQRHSEPPVPDANPQARRSWPAARPGV